MQNKLTTEGSATPVEVQIDDSPKFGRLLIVLLLAVLLMVAITVASEAFYS